MMHDSISKRRRTDLPLLWFIDYEPSVRFWLPCFVKQSLVNIQQVGLCIFLKYQEPVRRSLAFLRSPVSGTQTFQVCNLCVQIAVALTHDGAAEGFRESTYSPFWQTPSVYLPKQVQVADHKADPQPSDYGVLSLWRHRRRDRRCCCSYSKASCSSSTFVNRSSPYCSSCHQGSQRTHLHLPWVTLVRDPRT